MTTGKNKGGRPRNNPPCRRVALYLTDEQIKLLRVWGRGDMSSALRWLIEVVAPMVRRPKS